MGRGCEIVSAGRYCYFIRGGLISPPPPGCCEMSAGRNTWSDGASLVVCFPFSFPQIRPQFVIQAGYWLTDLSPELLQIQKDILFQSLVLRNLNTKTLKSCNRHDQADVDQTHHTNENMGFWLLLFYNSYWNIPRLASVGSSLGVSSYLCLWISQKETGFKSRPDREKKVFDRQNIISLLQNRICVSEMATCCYSNINIRAEVEDEAQALCTRAWAKGNCFWRYFYIKIKYVAVVVICGCKYLPSLHSAHLTALGLLRLWNDSWTNLTLQATNRAEVKGQGCNTQTIDGANIPPTPRRAERERRGLSLPLHYVCSYLSK